MADKIRTNYEVGLNETYHDNGDGTYSRVITTVDGAGEVKTNPITGLNEKWVLQGDGTYALLVSSV